MTSAVKGKTRAEAEALFSRVHDMVTGRQEAPPDDASLGSLAALSGVARFPIRVKCASLPWHALRSALAEGNGVVSTEAAGDG
jgi:nitrogen fixation NifU-like protein